MALTGCLSPRPTTEFRMSQQKPSFLFKRFEKLIDPFQAAPDTAPPDSVGAFYRYYLKQVWPWFAVLLVVGLAGSLVEVALFDFIGKIVDMAQSTPREEFFSAHGSSLLVMAIIALLVRPVLSGLHNLMVQQNINPNVTTLIRWQNHRYVLGQSLAFFQNDLAGRTASRILQTSMALRDSSVQMVDAMWRMTVYAGSAIYLFAQADWLLTLPLLFWLVCYIGLLFYFVPLARKRSAAGAASRAKLLGRIVDSYTNISTLKLFAHTRLEEAHAKEAMAEQTEKAQMSGRVVTAMDFAVTSLSGILIVGTAGLATWLWHTGQASLGVIALSTGLVIRINTMSGWIMWVVSGIFENFGIVQDGLRTIAQPRSVVDVQDAPPLQVTQGDIRFEHLRFHYDARHPVLRDIDLHIKPGEKIGLIGPSGVGKSTLVNLLLRLYDIQGGRILVDGQDIALVQQDSLREQIGIVTQEPSLLHRSIRENLLYGRPDASDAELQHALAQASAGDFVPRLTDGDGRQGLDAYVGERGVKLSGGQRQRIAIARVLLKNAPILVLDEATSALDSEVEAAIQDSLETLMRGKTVIAIAHRLSTIARMDRLVVLNQGQIVESGTHSELLSKGGLYARLWERQSGGFVAQDLGLQEASAEV